MTDPLTTDANALIRVMRGITPDQQWDVYGGVRNIPHTTVFNFAMWCATDLWTNHLPELARIVARVLEMECRIKELENRELKEKEVDK